MSTSPVGIVFGPNYASPSVANFMPGLRKKLGRGAVVALERVDHVRNFLALDVPANTFSPCLLAFAPLIPNTREDHLTKQVVEEWKSRFVSLLDPSFQECGNPNGEWLVTKAAALVLCFWPQVDKQMCLALAQSFENAYAELANQIP